MRKQPRQMCGGAFEAPSSMLHTTAILPRQGPTEEKVAGYSRAQIADKPEQTSELSAAVNMRQF